MIVSNLKEVAISFYRRYPPVLELGNLRPCCLPCMK